MENRRKSDINDLIDVNEQLRFARSYSWQWK